MLDWGEDEQWHSRMFRTDVTEREQICVYCVSRVSRLARPPRVVHDDEDYVHVFLLLFLK